MKKQQTFKLIDGVFEPSEAKSILFTLVNSKINFHSLESFGITIRNSGDTSVHKKRIEELTQTNSEIHQLIELASKNNQILKINGIIEIELMNDSGKN